MVAVSGLLYLGQDCVDVRPKAVDILGLGSNEVGADDMVWVGVLTRRRRHPEDCNPDENLIKNKYCGFLAVD